MDYNITKNGKHRLSVSGALQNENHAFAPFLPTDPPSQDVVNYSKGIIGSYNAVISNSLVNNFRYGFVRQSVGTIGNSDQDWIFFRGLNDQTGAVTRSTAFPASDAQLRRRRFLDARQTHLPVRHPNRDHSRAASEHGLLVQPGERERIMGRHSWLRRQGITTESSFQTDCPASIRTSQTPTTIRFRRCSDRSRRSMQSTTSRRMALRFPMAPLSSATSASTAMSSTRRTPGRLSQASRSRLVCATRCSRHHGRPTGLQVIPNVYMSQFFADRGNAGVAGIPSSSDHAGIV